MPFQKGHKKYSGIAKGQKQKKTLEWEQFGRDLLEAGLPRALNIMRTCDNNMFMDNFNKLLEYFKPKLARVEMQGDLNIKTVSETTIFQIKPKG